MSDAETQSELKREYLRVNIIENNYNPEEFIAYLTENYGENAADIEVYTFDELKKIVGDFQAKFQPQKEDSLENQQESNTKDISNEEQKEGEKKEEKSEVYSYHESEVFEDILTCNKIETSEISFSDITITISSPEKKEGGIFSKSYITYLVSTNPNNFEVRRRYSDFEWLRNILVTHFPAHWVPPIPFKNYSDRFDSEFIDKRMRYLEKFMHSLSKNPTFSSTKFFFDFLTVAKDSDFNDKKKAYAKLKAPAKLNEMLSVDGSVSYII